jgi:hypothetical protein
MKLLFATLGGDRGSIRASGVLILLATAAGLIALRYLPPVQQLDQRQHSHDTCHMNLTSGPREQLDYCKTKISYAR